MNFEDWLLSGHIERQPGRRVIRKVLRVEDYDCHTRRFAMEYVYSWNQVGVLDRNMEDYCTALHHTLPMER